MISETRATWTNATSLEITRGVAVRRGHGITHHKKTTNSRGPGEVFEAVTRGSQSNQSTSQRRQFPICGPPEEPLAEWEDGVLDQVLTEILGTGWDGSFMEELTSSTSTVTVPLDELAPLPEGWTGTDELRQLPASAINLIAERAAGQAGRGHRVRFALKGRIGTTSSR